MATMSMATMSYVSGTSAVPLLGDTIGQQLDRDGRRAWATGSALVVRQQGVRLTWARTATPRSTRFAAGLLALGLAAGRPGRHLVAQQRRMGASRSSPPPRPG